MKLRQRHGEIDILMAYKVRRTARAPGAADEIEAAHDHRERRDSGNDRLQDAEDGRAEKREIHAEHR